MASRKRTTSGKRTAAPRKRVTPKKKENVAPAMETRDFAAEMQDLGVDVVPTGEISVGGAGDGAGPAGGDAGAPKSLLSEWDYHLFNEGSHHRLWEKLGAHVVPGGTIFGVWAPNAASVSVVGDWNGWSHDANPLTSHGPSGIWEGFVPNAGKGAKYKFHIHSRHGDYSVD